jgi:hypothetical protein
MPGTLLVRHPPWRQLLIVSLAAPILVTLAVLAFAWPASSTAPRDLPVGVVGTGAEGQHLVEGLTRSRPGAFDLHLYADDADARTAIKDRTVYGAFETAPQKLTLLTASAEGPAVTQLLTTVATQVQGGTFATVDVVPSSADDPRSAVFTALMSPLVLGGEILAVIVAVLVAFRPAWRQLLALTVVSAGTAVGILLVVQTGLGALPGDHLANWGALALTLFALCATTAGLAAMVGPAGVALGAALMVFVGNPFSGITSAPELLPKAVGRLGQLLPPGAGSKLIRSTAYFDGNGAALHVVVLVSWSLLGTLLILEGHRRARRRHLAQHREHLFEESPLHDALERDALQGDAPQHDVQPGNEPINVTFRNARGVVLPR